MEKQQKSNKNKQILDEEKKKKKQFLNTSICFSQYRGQGKNFLFFADQFRSWSVIYCKGDRAGYNGTDQKNFSDSVHGDVRISYFSSTLSYRKLFGL